MPSSIYNEVDSRFLKEHNRRASTCPWRNLRPVYGTSIKRKIGIRGAITQQCEKRFPISYLALKLRYINKTHTQSWVEKSLSQFSFLSSHLALKLGYINKTNTHILEVELKSLYFNFVWLLQNRIFSYLSRGNEKLLKSQSFTRR